MIRRSRTLSVLAVFLPALALGAASRTPAPEPKLAVVISVDGLGFSRLVGYRPWFVAGLKRILDEGHVERAARYQHLNTETGPGHASLGTGAPPRVTGIVANSWFEAGADGSLHAVYCTDQRDPAAPAGTARVIPGPGNLRVPTLGDRLVETRKGARVVSLSAKDRGAIFLAGRERAHSVYWYDKETGRFVSSSAFDPPSAVRVAVRKFNETKAGTMLPGRFGLVWKKWPDPPCSARTKPLPTPVPASVVQRYQYPVHGLGFDHDLSRFGVIPTGDAPGYFGGLYRSPLVDELTADLALDLLNDPELKLGRGDQPDLLCLSFSAHDPVSHDYGNESEEELDTLRRLDVQLGRLLDALEARYAKGAVLVALSADHGFPVIPEVAKAIDKTASGGRIDVGSATLDNFRERLNRMLDETLCLDAGVKPVFGMDGWDLFYDRKVLPAKSAAGACGAAGRPVTAADVDRVLPGLVKLVWGAEVEDVLLTSQAASWRETPALPFVKNDFDAQRSGDVILVPRWGVQTSYNPGRGSMHGTHYEYDIHVPLIFWGAGVKAGASDAPSTPYDLAPTVGQWLGVTLPQAVGKALSLPR
ncbi:MAG TPA: alkaline phosphatase family protein [Thermoanaerobaculia bacterium]|nr:alkaline phosphatase family protein [Thermoanaerobaculia bacterium]